MTVEEIESPFTQKKYKIRELDPFVLSIFSKPDTPEIKQLRIKIADLISDIELEQERQKKLKKEDPVKIKALEDKLNEYYIEVAKAKRLDGSELENRQKLLQFGIVEPKVNTIDDFLDLGIDGSFLWTAIVKKTKLPDNYNEVMDNFFRTK